METLKLKRFAQYARRSLIEQVSAKLKLVLAENSAARRERAEAIKKLEEAIKGHSKEQVIERVAYIWFNRFCALRFMDVNRYNRVNIVSPADPGQFQPEILAEAKMGHIDDEMVHDKVRQQIFALLDGKAPSRDPQGEAYRLLVVAACNFWNKAMPFLFQRIDDYTELLMPDDLLSGNSILAYTREAMTPDACEDVEVIGWLYQFYISEKKDEVFDGLKKNKKITPENIPAATQLFTPHWIVRYLVENSLGRLWLLNRPGSKLVEQMDYYIKPADGDQAAETDFLRINKPEEIKICDPACGSGHMLTYAFELLYAIYEEEGYEPAEIPEKILTHNLYGIEIDERAGELAAFALTMKARAKQRRFFNKGVKPNICVLENVRFDGNELKDYMDFVGRDLFTAPLQTTLRQFEEADNFGSLIRPDVTDVDGMLRILESKNVSGQLFISMTHQKVLQALRQADYLSPKYHVVIANPPYMGARNMSGRLATWLKDNYETVKTDLFSAFIVRNTELTLPKGQLGFMSPFVWMFISSYGELRELLINKKTLTSLVQLEYSGFDGATVPICTFTVENALKPEFRGGYVRLSKFRGSENQGPRTIEAIKNPGCGWFYRASAPDFKKIPGSPIAYWVSDKEIGAYASNQLLGNACYPRKGLDTGENDKFLRLWHEVSLTESCLDNSDHSRVWFPYNKGGDFRRWYGNREYLINWQNDGFEIKQRLSWASKKPTIRNADYYFREGFAWTTISSGGFSARYSPPGALFDNGGCTIFADSALMTIGGFVNTKIMSRHLEFLSPTLNFQPGDIARAPFPRELLSVKTTTQECVTISSSDWDAYETSWDFTSLPLLNPDYHQPTLKATYQKLRAHWRELTLEMQRLEEENNRIFIEAYGLQDELTPEVPLNEITLTCNPHYRYGNDKSEDELEALLLADTMRELVSYAVGCMFGRYALDKPGLILANQGETIEDYLKRVPEPSFPADDDNVIPMLDGDWFTDDIAERFRKFLRVAFGDEHYEANLKFVENALGKNGKARDIRDYFLKDFYSDHVRRYKKRPIYWLFSSPKGSFNALIYMHRYRPDTVSVVLNDYLREFRTKLTSHKNHLEAVSISASSSQGEKTKALKEIEKITKMIAEMEEYEREVLYPLATEQVEIDLDEGVKANYPKLGAALKKIVGLDAKED
jgi:Eco57I restriction endonuclease.